MDREALISFFINIVGHDNVRRNEALYKHTSFKVGGPADIFITPENIEQLIKIYRKCLEEEVQLYILGNCTNLIVTDSGLRGVVIKIGENLSNCIVSGDVIKADAGILLSRLSKIALEHGLTGFEFAEGIPGTLGGAVAMNAGAYCGEIADVVARTQYLDSKGELIVLEGTDHKFGKRSSFIQSDGGIVLQSEIKLKKGNVEEIKANMDTFNKQRREKQPLELPSAGSIFKRPEGYFAGKLIEDCGLKGFTIGGAEVSCKHCGFIVNKGNATAQDIMDLIAHIKKTVMNKYGVELQTEVKIIGEMNADYIDA